MRLPGDEVVDLHEVEARHAPEAARLLDLRRSVRGGRGPDLLGGKQRLGPAELFEPVADHRLRGAVHRRGIDHAPACLEEGGHHVGAFVAQHRIVADIEGDPGAEPDRRDRLAGGGDGPHQGRMRRGGRGSRQGESRSGSGGSLHECPAGDDHPSAILCTPSLAKGPGDRPSQSPLEMHLPVRKSSMCRCTALERLRLQLHVRPSSQSVLIIVREKGQGFLEITCKVIGQLSSQPSASCSLRANRWASSLRPERCVATRKSNHRRRSDGWLAPVDLFAAPSPSSARRISSSCTLCGSVARDLDISESASSHARRCASPTGWRSPRATSGFRPLRGRSRRSLASIQFDAAERIADGSGSRRGRSPSSRYSTSGIAGEKDRRSCLRGAMRTWAPMLAGSWTSRLCLLAADWARRDAADRQRQSPSGPSRALRT